MFGLFRRSPAPRVGGGLRTVLRLEALGGRAQPSSLDPVGAYHWGGTDPDVRVGEPGDGAGNAAPAILDFTVEEIGNGLFLITGQVSDESPGGLTVTLGGSTTAAGRTIQTYADGTFSMTVQLRVDGTDCGYITATTTDAQGVQSAMVMEFADPTRPL